ncbi:MAG TPA: hypothetical protein PLO61_04335 [Fimbriimonadaceae bacterium]|nr:hypothetical protein [Fimbriimonadaceae bacterium]HRJ32811.1 hypothetical protein [Fimbriimonadaceae bacterium]
MADIHKIGNYWEIRGRLELEKLSQEFDANRNRRMDKIKELLKLEATASEREVLTEIESLRDKAESAVHKAETERLAKQKKFVITRDIRNSSVALILFFLLFGLLVLIIMIRQAKKEHISPSGSVNIDVQNLHLHPQGVRPDEKESELTPTPPSIIPQRDQGPQGRGS